MAREIINIGVSANDNTGDPLRSAFTKVNNMTAELYTDDASDVNSIVATAPIARDNATGVVTISLTDGGISTQKIADDAVTTDKLANAINSAITANTAKVTNATHTGDVTGNAALTIAADAVITTKILNANVTTAKIADDAVTADKLANSINTEIAANTAKLTNATHTGDVTGSGALTIAADAVNGDKIADDSIGSEHIDDNAVGAAALNVSGNGTDGQILKSDGDGTMSWITNDVGDITSVVAGNGLTGGGTAGDVTLTVGAGTGITVASGTVSVTSGSITATQLGANSATPAKVSLFDDNAAATNTHILVADGTDFINKAISGDATLANTGALTIANDAVTIDKIADAVIVTASEGIGSNDNDTTIPTSAATKAYVDNSASGGISVSVITGNTNAASGNLYVLTANLTLTLPSSPSAGNYIKISNRSGVATCVVARNSEKIMGATADLTLDKLNSGFEMVYSGTAQGWVLIGVEGTAA
jgi:hypothetical protein